MALIRAGRQYLALSGNTSLRLVNVKQGIFYS
jgi:hypothetical protein